MGGQTRADKELGSRGLQVSQVCRESRGADRAGLENRILRVDLRSSVFGTLSKFSFRLFSLTFRFLSFYRCRPPDSSGKWLFRGFVN